MTAPSFSMIAAVDDQYGLGLAGDLAWRLSGDQAYFKRVTSDTLHGGARNAVIMGRKTWISIPARFRPLPGRLNVVMSRNPDWVCPDGVEVSRSLDEALHTAARSEGVSRLFLVGGARIYKLGLEHPGCERIYLTHVQGDFGCDAFFPRLNERFEEEWRSDPRTENGITYEYAVYACHP